MFKLASRFVIFVLLEKIDAEIDPGFYKFWIQSNALAKVRLCLASLSFLNGTYAKLVANRRVAITRPLASTLSDPLERKFRSTCEFRKF